MRVCVCIYVHISLSLYIYIYTYTHTHMLNIYIYIYICIVHMHIHVYGGPRWVSKPMTLFGVVSIITRVGLCGKGRGISDNLQNFGKLRAEKVHSRRLIHKPDGGLPFREPRFTS